jgi:lipopolysaccharide/colanic/teichoic acid biosynthesis glycosyltransferase
MYAGIDNVPDELANRTDEAPVRLRSLPPRLGGALGAPRGWYACAKRALDFALALALLVLSAPLLFVAGLLVKLTSRGPVFYSQVRVGRGGRPFTIYKVRTMRHDCERLSGARWCRPGDPRIFLVGRLLRRTHLDELPQLWNVLRGDMSLVGPRPERPEFVPQLELAVPRYRERLAVLPGVTGLAQVHLPPDTDLASVRRKLAFDLYYIRTLGLWGDLRVLLATAVHVFVPYLASRWLFRLTERDCAQAVTPPEAPIKPSNVAALSAPVPNNG